MRKAFFWVACALGVVIAVSVGLHVWQNGLFGKPKELSKEEMTIVSDPHAGDVHWMGDADLQSALIAGMSSLVLQYQTDLGLKMSKYLKEYVGRGLINTEINSLNDTLIEKNGPCWGIPKGECSE